MSVLLLHLETSTKVCSVALSKDGVCIGCYETSSDAYVHAEQLTPFIEGLMTEKGIAFRELHGISISSGPGSYTGLRIGVSTAKGLCYALGIPLIAIDSLLCLAIVAKEKHPNTNLCALIDARRMEEYAAIYDQQLQPVKQISADIMESISYQEFEPFVFFGDGAEKVIELWSDRNCTPDLTIASTAKAQCSLAYQKYIAQTFEDVAYFEPYYLKDFVSTAKKK
jgi:tRNA threonylcarbamoyladenosine biosynthesis protein TsaB